MRKAEVVSQQHKPETARTGESPLARSSRSVRLVALPLLVIVAALAGSSTSAEAALKTSITLATISPPAPNASSPTFTVSLPCPNVDVAGDTDGYCSGAIKDINLLSQNVTGGGAIDSSPDGRLPFTIVPSIGPVLSITNFKYRALVNNVNQTCPPYQTFAKGDLSLNGLGGTIIRNGQTYGWGGTAKGSFELSIGFSLLGEPIPVKVTFLSYQITLQLLGGAGTYYATAVFPDDLLRVAGAGAIATVTDQSGVNNWTACSFAKPKSVDFWLSGKVTIASPGL